MWHPTKDAVQRLWGRRWIRRVSYAVVAGASVITIAPWLATRPAVVHWALGQLSIVVQDETGLPLSIGQVEIHPTFGSLVLHDVRLGGDLLTVKRIEVRADLWSLLGTTPRIYSLWIEHPHLRLTEAGLTSIKLKDRPPRSGPLPQFRLDFLSLTNGEIQVPVALRNIPELRYQFEAKATGGGPNRVRMDLVGPQLSVNGPEGWEKGRLDLNGEASEKALAILAGYLRLGESQLRFNGRYEAGKLPTKDRLEAHLTGVLDLAQASRWRGSARPSLIGSMDVVGTLQGSTAQPAWTFIADGHDLRPETGAFLPGELELKANGGLDHARLDRLHWVSPQGELEVQGSWSHRTQVQATLQGTNLDLDTLGRALHLEAFQGVRGTLQAQIKGPGNKTAACRPEHWQASLKVALAQHGTDAGGLDATLDRGRINLDHLKLDLEALKLEGMGWATLGPQGLIHLEGEGRTEVGADQVARALSAWKVVDLDMEGQTTAQAKVRWNRGTGLELDGSCEVLHPRWHGARADSLLAKVVEIRGSDLWIKDIDLHKGEGRGGGNLWLTWAATTPGQPQIDMCYTATQLPVAEGLKAADLKDGEDKDLPITGTGNGWVRLWGPYDHLVMAGAAQGESCEIYGIKVPAVSSDFWMDLESLRLKLSDLRVAERMDLLGHGELRPEGALALSGRADMDFGKWTWWVDLNGRLDSQLLALPGPRIQTQVEAHFLGPITRPFGNLDLPEGKIQLSRGRLFFGNRSIDGLEGQASLEQGRLLGHLGMEGMTLPLLDLQTRQDGPDLTGRLSLNISSDSAHTDLLARGLTEDLLEDLSLSATAQGRWKNGHDLVWNGSLDRLAAQFGAFELHQIGSSALHGNAHDAGVDINLEGGARGSAGQADIQAAHIRLSGTVPFSGTAPMAIQAQGDADLTHLKSILDRVMEVDDYSLLSELNVQGTSRFDLLAHGTPSEPLLNGTITLDQAQMHLRGYQGVEDLQAQVILKDRTLTISEANPMRGTLAHGELRASGAATWRIGGLDAYAFKAALANFQLRDVPEGLDLQGSLQATLEGNEDGGLLKGKLRADHLSYQTEVKLSDLILRSALRDNGGLVGLDLDDPLERIRLDLDLDLRSPWSFDTNLLKMEGRIEGPFQVLGTLAHPVPKGTMLFQPGGRVTNIFPAGDMVVDRGTLTFSEFRPLDPMINLQGSVNSIPGYTVNLDIRGTLSNLTILPSSTPSLRPDEIVSILINPGNVANVGTAGVSSGATQGAITSGLGSAGVGLISTLAFAPVQDQLRRALGVDRVNVAVRSSSLGTSETEFTMGKSLDLFGQRSAIVVTHTKSGELSIDSGQVEWRFGNLILLLGVTKGGGVGLGLSGEIRHSWSPN
jgi:hypothetical protein